MDRETIDLYLEYLELIDTDIEDMSLEELFNLRFEILRLREIILQRLDEICDA